jgi:hypothetical protein
MDVSLMPTRFPGFYLSSLGNSPTPTYARVFGTI